MSYVLPAFSRGSSCPRPACRSAPSLGARFCAGSSAHPPASCSQHPALTPAPWDKRIIYFKNLVFPVYFADEKKCCLACTLEGLYFFFF
jgi:hypothetical protein